MRVFKPPAEVVLLLLLMLLSLLWAALGSPAYGRVWMGRGGGGGNVPVVGPGAPGWLATCSSNFAVTNYLLQTNTWASPWGVAATGGANAPTLTANAVAAPDSTMTAARLSIPAISSAVGNAGASSVNQSFSGAGSNYTFSVWMRGETGNEQVSLTSNRPAGPAVPVQKTIVLTTSWQQVSLNNFPTDLNNPNSMEIGVDLRPAGSPASAPAMVIDIWHPQVNELAWAFGYIATTTATAGQTQTVPCPPGTAFRDFTNLTFDTSHGIAGHGVTGGIVWPQNSASTNGTIVGTAAWNVGGSNNPYRYPWGTIGGTYYAFGACSLARPATTGNPEWSNLCLYYGDGLYNWTDTGVGNPVVSYVPGTWEDHYILHPAISPDLGQHTACGASTVCMKVYYSAEDTSATGNPSIGMLTSADGTHWTKYSSNPVIAIYGAMLPTIAQVGSEIYMYTTGNGNIGKTIIMWKSAFGDGVKWEYAGTAMPQPLPADWDYNVVTCTNNAGQIDPYVWKNKHGFYEMVYTSFNFCGTAHQWLGYAMSPDGLTWWRRQDARTGDETSPFAPDAQGPYVGNWVVFEIGGTFYMSLTRDNAGTPGYSGETGYVAFGFISKMPDY
jgi:hypothetical protein